MFSLTDLLTKRLINFHLTYLSQPARTVVLASAFAATLTGCGTMMPSSGPSTAAVQSASQSSLLQQIKVVELNNAVVNRLLQIHKQNLFSETFALSANLGNAIGRGDILEVSIWEVPPALFSGTVIEQRAGGGAVQVIRFPEQMVSHEGTISVPYAGPIPVAGRSIAQVEAEIVRRLKGKANQPQVLVRTVRNNTTNVTIVGEVVSSNRMPLTARKERLLDALAAAGGVRQAVNKMTLQLTRGQRVHSLPLDVIIRDPRQNITLQPDDVVTLLFQPLSFTALGATGKNEEVNFETQGISLVQALGRVGGLQDSRADAKGVFIFRFESPDVLGITENNTNTNPEGKVPVIYTIDLKNPATFFLAQNFLIENKDILYVSNAPAADLQKFLNMVVSAIYPVVNVINTLPSLR